MKPCIYTGHYSEYKAAAAVCLPREVKGEETTGISYSPNTFLFIYYSITLNWPLTSSSSSRQNYPQMKMAALLNQTEIKQSPWGSVV